MTTTFTSNLYNLNEWFTQPVFQNTSEKVQVQSAYKVVDVVETRRVYESLYSATYYSKFENLQKRSTLRLRKMYERTFEVNAETVDRDTMLVELHDHLLSFYREERVVVGHDVHLMYFDPVKQVWFDPNDKPEVCLETTVVGRGRPRKVPLWLQEALYWNWVEMGANKWNDLLKMFEDVAEAEGVTLYPQLVRQLCVTFVPDETEYEYLQ